MLILEVIICVVLFALIAAYLFSSIDVYEDGSNTNCNIDDYVLADQMSHLSVKSK